MIHYTPAWRRQFRDFVLAAHLTSSIGWVGAAAAFLALAVIGMTSGNELVARGAYLVMDPAAWLVLVPLAFASLTTGVLISLITPWGLFRHYWVVFKLLITAFATLVLLTYTTTFSQLAGVAGDLAVPIERVRNPSPVLHSVLAIVLLTIATVLAVYKPTGLTPFARSAGEPASPMPAWARVFAVLSAVVGVAYVVAHLHGAGPAMHISH